MIIYNKKNRGSIYCSAFILKIFIIIYSITFCSCYGQAQSISVSPPRLFFQVAAGASSSQKIHIQNPGNAPMIFATSLRDWVRDSLGNKVYSAPGKLPQSNADWILVTPQQITIAPGTSEDITVNMHVPENAPAISNSMLFLSQISEQKPVFKEDKNGRRVGINIKLEVGIHLYNTLPLTQIHKDLEFISFENRGKNTDSTILLTLKIKNNGNLITDAKIKLEMTNKATGSNLQLNDIPLSMFPDGEQVVRFTLPANMPKGKYQLIAIMDGGNNSDLKVAKKEITYD